MSFTLSSSRRDALRRAVVCGVAMCAGVFAGCTDQARSPLAPPDDALLAVAPSYMEAVSGSEQIGVAGDTLTQALTVEVRGGGSRLPNVTVYWSVVSGGGGLRFATSTTNSVGRASNRWMLGHSGEQRVKAEVPGAGSVVFNARAIPAGSTLRIISGNNQTGLMNGNYLLHPLVVELVDGNGNPLSGIPVTWTPSSASALLARAGTPTGSNGRTEVLWALGRTTEAKTLRASVGRLAVVFSATGIKRVLFTLVSGNNQVGPSTDTLPAPLVVQVRDTLGAPLPGIRVFWSAQAYGYPPGSLRASTTGTDSQGRASNRWILAARPDSQFTTASIGYQHVYPAEAAPDIKFTARLGTLPPAATLTVGLSPTTVYSRHVGAARDLAVTVNARSVKGITQASVRFLRPGGAELPGGCSWDFSADPRGIVAETCTVRIPFGAAHGWYTAQVQVADAAGNTDAETRTFRVDATTPLTSSAASISPTTVSSSAAAAARQVTGSMTATSSQGVTQLTVTLLTAGNPQCSKALSGATTVTDSCALTVPQGLAPGTYTVRVRMTDAAGNVVGVNRVLTVTS